jgi:HEAT repeat protein
LPHVATLLASPIARVRYYAADHYGQLPAAFARRGGELAPVLADGDPSVAAAAAWAVGRLGDRTAAPGLTPLLRHREQDVRATAVMALLTLGTGTREIVAAMRDGAGELSVIALTVLHPTLTPALMMPISNELAARLASDMSVDALLREASVAATDELRAAYAAERCQIALKPGSPIAQAVIELAMSRRWGVTFEAEQLVLTTPAAAADWWAARLG